MRDLFCVSASCPKCLSEDVVMADVPYNVFTMNVSFIWRKFILDVAIISTNNDFLSYMSNCSDCVSHRP